MLTNRTPVGYDAIRRDRRILDVQPRRWSASCVVRGCVMARVVVFFKFADGTTLQTIVAGKTSYPDALAQMRAEAVRAFKEAHAAALAEPVPTIEDTDDSTRDDLEEALGHLNQGAKDIRRKGYIGTASKAYEIQYGRINAVLDDWSAASEA